MEYIALLIDKYFTHLKYFVGNAKCINNMDL